MDKNLKDIYIIANCEEFVFREVFIKGLEIQSGFLIIKYTSYNVKTNSNNEQTLFLPYLKGIKITID